MRGIAVSCVAIAVIAVVEIVLPGRDVYHYGWFNVAVIALAVLASLSLKRATRAVDGRYATTSAIAVAAGAVLALAIVVNGLLAPDTRSIVGAPGQHVRVDELAGSLVFPLASRNASSDVQLVTGDTTRDIGARRFTGSFLLRTVERPVIAVDARDARGGRLTVTQPSGTAFLSPVLMLQSRETIAGMNLPYDSFAVPAARRIFKAVLFSAREAAALRGFSASGPAVLLAADDETDRPLPNGIVLVRDGGSAVDGGVRVRVDVLEYPAVDVIAVPNPMLAIVGIAGLVTACVFGVAIRTRP